MNVKAKNVVEHEKVIEVLDAPLNEVTPAGTTPAFEVVRAVTRPVIKFGAAPEYVRIESSMYKGEALEKAKIKTVPTLLDVVNLRTGEAALIVVAKVLELELERTYPGGSYIGKDYQIRKIKTDKDYSLWAIAEIKLK